jgi:hypothetical protein
VLSWESLASRYRILILGLSGRGGIPFRQQNPAEHCSAWMAEGGRPYTTHLPATSSLAAASKP